MQKTPEYKNAVKTRAADQLKILIMINRAIKNFNRESHNRYMHKKMVTICHRKG